jgi:hypothetical protein
MNCVFCGSAEVSEQLVFPETFTAYQLLQAGDKACSRCYAMLKDAKFRRNCWYMKGEEWVTISNPLQFLEELPEPPFVLYLTKAKRKHGWIGAVQNPVLNSNRFILCVDEDRVMFDRKKFEVYLQFLESLWIREVPKGIMLGGYPPAGIIRKYQLSRVECQQLQQLQSDRLWRFVVAFKKRKEEKTNELEQ